MKTFDLSQGVRELNQALHDSSQTREIKHWQVVHPDGAHNIACGVNDDVDITIEGHAGYYCAGMNQKATITIQGNAGVGVAENMMSGSVRVKGDASQSAGATGNGGLFVIEVTAAARCGMSMTGIHIVVNGYIGPMAPLMAPAG